MTPHLRRTPPAVGIFPAFVLIGWCGGCLAQSVAFVSSVERFARHGQIAPIDAGRLLISELSCVKCHASEASLLQPKGGPSLRAAGRRLNESWIRDYLADPSSVHPGTTMPDMLGGLTPQDRRDVAIDLAAFLATQQQDFPELKASGATPVPFEFWNRGNVDAGRDLYHTVGCVACHEPDAGDEVVTSPGSAFDAMLEELDEDELQELGLADAARPVLSVRHPDLAAKYTVQGLAFFLLDPHRSRSGGRMPDLKLSPVQAADLTRFLTNRDGNETDPAGEQEAADERTGDKEAGRRAFKTFRCVACHEVRVDDSIVTATTSRPLDRLSVDAKAVDASAGCLRPGHTPGASYLLDDFQREAIIAALSSIGASEKPTTSQRLEHRLLQLNCYACHVRDERGGIGRRRKAFFHSIGDIDLGDEGRLPPPLTRAGRKIRPAWFAKVLTGDKADIRPHMTIRMPKFPRDRVDALPGWFAEVDAAGSAAPDGGPSDDDLIEAGRELMDIGCVECHSFDGFTMPGVVGVELSGVTERVNREWFQAFLRDPGSLKQRTRMPNFFDAGKTQNAKLLGGDPDRQIAAMWAYLKDVPKHTLPKKIRESRSQTYELAPSDRPIMLRTFMPGAGTHAIAVGFPQGVHFAFDAERVRLATVWRGKFLDAQGTWFIRFAPPAEPLGTSIIELSTDGVFATAPNGFASDPNGDVTTAPARPRFGGYRLDAAGVPTFLYRFDDIEIRDRIVAADDGSGLHRTWHLEPAPVDPASVETTNEGARRIAFSPLAAQNVKSIGNETFANDDGLTVRARRLPGDTARIVSQPDGSTGDRQRLVFLIDVTSPMTLEVDYSW